MKQLFFLLLFISSAAGTTLHAQTRTQKVNKIQIKHQKKIRTGIKNGEITKREVHNLQKEQKHIAFVKHRAKADGVVTKKERVKIRAKQKNAASNISRQKQDRQKRRR